MTERRDERSFAGRAVARLSSPRQRGNAFVRKYLALRLLRLVSASRSISARGVTRGVRNYRG